MSAQAWAAVQALILPQLHTFWRRRDRRRHCFLPFQSVRLVPSMAAAPRKRCHFAIWWAWCENDSCIFHAAPDKRGRARGLFIRISAFLAAPCRRVRLVFLRLQRCFNFFPPYFTRETLRLDDETCICVDEILYIGQARVSKWGQQNDKMDDISKKSPASLQR